MQVTSNNLKRVVPLDLFDGCVISQSGQYVDIAPLLPDAQDDSYTLEYRDRIQSRYDWMAKTALSSEFKSFQTQTVNSLAEVKQQYFLFDIEGTLMNSIRHFGDESERTYYLDLYMQSVILALLSNNHLGFFTSSSSVIVGILKQCMRPELRNLQIISRDEWKTTIETYIAKSKEEISDQEAFERILHICGFARPESFARGIEIFNPYKIKQYQNDPDKFLREIKYPQIFLPLQNAFFIDDSSECIVDASIMGLPPGRAIKCQYDGREQGANEVITAIKNAIKP